MPRPPETSESVEGGFKFGLKQLGLSGTVAVYRQHRNNVPLTDPFFVTRQVGQQRAQGLEADLIWEPSKNFSLLASYAYTDAKVTRDQFTPANIGQRLSRVCASTHDVNDPHFQLFLRPITIGEQCWVAADAFVSPGVTMHDRSVLAARAVLFTDAQADTIYRGNPAEVLKPRRLRAD